MQLLCTMYSARDRYLILHCILGDTLQSQPQIFRRRPPRWLFLTQGKCANCGTSYILYYAHRSVSWVGPTPKLGLIRSFNSANRGTRSMSYGTGYIAQGQLVELSGLFVFFAMYAKRSSASPMLQWRNLHFVQWWA